MACQDGAVFRSEDRAGGDECGSTNKCRRTGRKGGQLYLEHTMGPWWACHFSALLVGQACWVVETLGKQRTQGKRGKVKAGLWGPPFQL